MLWRYTLLASVMLAFAAPAARAADACPAPTAGADDWEAQHQWIAIEQAGLRVGRIDIAVTEVYESDTAWYARGINFLHVATRDNVVREKVLLAPGATVDALLIYDSARRLRDVGLFREISILPIACHDGVVDIKVSALDAWTLMVSITANSVGGQTNTGFKLEDRNFLGSGKEVSIETEQDANRSSLNYGYSDPSLFGSQWYLSLIHRDQSDGISNSAAVALPFYTGAQLWGFDSYYDDTQETLSFYQKGEVGWEAQSTNRLSAVNVWRLLTRDADSGWRAGLGARSEERGYGPAVPIDPSLRPAPDLAPFASDGITLSLSRFHYRYESFRNVKVVDKTEDYNLGLDATLSFTFAPDGTGPGGDEGTRFGFDATWAAKPNADWLVQWDLESHARQDPSGWRDGFVDSTITAYQQVGRHTRVGRLALEWREQPDPEHESSLGGENGVLGYPAQYVVGDRHYSLHLEDRWNTDKVLFQTFRVGYSVIGEIGQGREIGTHEWSQTLANVGGGFRIGNLRGAHHQVLYFTVFFPLVRPDGVDSHQFVVGDIIDF